MESLTIKDTQKLLYAISKLFSHVSSPAYSNLALELVIMLLNRSQCNFTKSDLITLNLLSLYLFEAYENVQKYQELKQNLAQLYDSLNSLALVIVNDVGQIELITPLAIERLQIYFAEFDNFNRLPEHLWSWLRHQVSTFKDNHLSGKAGLSLRIEKSDRQLVIRLVIEQRRERYFLLLEENTLSLLSCLELLGLSTRETEVLFWVIRGKDNKAIASFLSVHISTVRKHLENIYLKLGVQSRTEAIARSLEKLGILN
jgi:DNA-binding CsgD family transcriptional regulator